MSQRLPHCPIGEQDGRNVRVKECEDDIGLEWSGKIRLSDVHHVEMPEGQKKQEYQTRCEHQRAETLYPDAPRLCGGSVLRVGINHTYEHPNCKNFKEFACIAVEVWFKDRKEKLKNSISLGHTSDIEPPEPCEQAPDGHEE